MPPRFEYALIDPFVDVRPTVRFPDGSEQSYSDRIAVLNELGRVGWELLGVVEGRGPMAASAYLKREIVE